MEKSDLFRGNVDTVILKVLFEGDRYGYDMIKQINARSGGQWEIKQATFYACLKKLEKQGFVTSYWDASESNGGRRKYYTLTDRGRDVFVSYKSEWERSRDLFGELITDDNDSFVPSDDFSDVEDDEYTVPKRRTSRPRVKKPVEKAFDEPEIMYEPPAYDGHEYELNSQAEPQTEPEPAEEVDEADEADEPVNGQTDEASEPDDDVVSEESPAEYVQQSMFDAYHGYDVSDGEIQDEEPEPSPDYSEGQPVPTQITENASGTASDDEKVAPTADPRAIIDELYAATYTGNRSYAEARRTTGDDYTEPHEERAPVAAAPTPAAVQPATPAAPPAVKDSATALQPYSGGLPRATAEESPARKAYKDILGDLIERSEARTEAEKNAKAAARADESAAAADTATVSRFDGVKQAMAELGNAVVLREHDDAPKQYAHKYHYYSNRLMMTHYTAMCAIMFVLGLVAFLTMYFGLGLRMKYDYILYVAAGLLPIIMFIAAVIIFAGDPDKTKRINVNFRFSIIIRVVIMVQVAVIIYCVNLIWGMPVSFSKAYMPSLIIPLIYSVFIPISEVIFMTLLKSEHYAV